MSGSPSPQLVNSVWNLALTHWTTHCALGAVLATPPTSLAFQAHIPAWDVPCGPSLTKPGSGEDRLEPWAWEARRAVELVKCLPSP